MLTEAGVDADVVFDEIATGKPLALVKAEHTEAVQGDHVWGVPTFVVDGQCGLHPAHGPPGRRRRRSAAGPSSGSLDLLTWPELNEFKHTTISR